MVVSPEGVLELCGKKQGVSDKWKREQTKRKQKARVSYIAIA
jgi:hypothetical protein